MPFNARVLADSVSPDNVRLTTLEVTFPRIVLAEFNTHRVFSRNSASSRAIPVSKMIERVENDPFEPVYWGKNQKGMQAQEELSDKPDPGWGYSPRVRAQQQWHQARLAAIDVVKRMQQPDIDLHKQIANRLLEPWLFHTVIVTATEWDNFWGLRCHPDAQPEIRKAAELMREAIGASEPRSIDYEAWHLPLIEPAEAFDLQVSGMSVDDLCRVSAGRCARVSYLTHDGRRDPQADIELCSRLASSGHMSPMEHVARPMTGEDAEKIFGNPGVVGIDVMDIDVKQVFCGNFRGLVQLRKCMPNESNFLQRPQA